jgi:hypothetical protein
MHFGSGNFGDDLTLQGFLHARDSLCAAGCELVACTPYDIESQRRRFPQIRWLPDDEATREEALRSADVWVGLGSTPFQLDSGPWMLDDLDRKRERCRLLGLPMVFLGAGCNSPDAVADDRARRIIAAAERLWTRDAYTAELLDGLAPSRGVSSGADLANLALAARSAPPVEAGLLGLLLAMERSDTVDMLAVEDALAERAPRRTRWLLQEARLFACSERWNYATLSEWTQSLVELMPLVYATDDIDTFARAFGAPEIVVSSRYHGTLLAAWHGCRVAVVERSGKLKALASDLRLPLRPRIAHGDLTALAAQAAKADPALLATLADRSRAMCAEFFEWLGLSSVARSQAFRHQPSSVS